MYACMYSVYVVCSVAKQLFATCLCYVWVRNNMACTNHPHRMQYITDVYRAGRWARSIRGMADWVPVMMSDCS